MSAWPSLPFSDVFADETSGNLKTLQSNYLAAGSIPIIDQGKELIGGYTEDDTRICKSQLPAIIFGDHTKIIKFVDFPFCLGADGTKVLRPKVEADEKYLFHFLQSVEITDAGYSRHFKYLKKLNIPLPPLDEQKRIAAILDQAEALRRLRRRAIDRLNALGQSIFYEMFGDPASNPMGWELTAFDDVVRFGSSLVDPKLPQFELLPHITPAHIKEGSGEIEYSEIRSAKEDGVISGKFLFDETAVLYSKIRPYLNKVALPNISGVCSADMYALRPNTSRINRNYLKNILMSGYFLRYAERCSSRANIPKINQNQLKAFSIPLPKIELQNEFSSRIGYLSISGNQTSKSNVLTETLFASLQQRAFAGEL